MTPRLAIATLAVLLGALAPSPAHSAPDPASVARGSLETRSVAQAFQCLAHCEGVLTGIDLEDFGRFRDGFGFLYRYRWKSLGIFNNQTELEFDFDSAGNLTTIAVHSDSSSFPTFLAADALLDLLKDKIKDASDMKKLPAWAQRRLAQLLDNADAKDALILLFNLGLLT